MGTVCSQSSPQQLNSQNHRVLVYSAEPSTTSLVERVHPSSFLCITSSPALSPHLCHHRGRRWAHPFPFPHFSEMNHLNFFPLSSTQLRGRHVGDASSLLNGYTNFMMRKWKILGQTWQIDQRRFFSFTIQGPTKGRNKGIKTSPGIGKKGETSADKWFGPVFWKMENSYRSDK